MDKTIFIDRDGVINKDLWRYVEHWDEFEFLPGVLETFKLLEDKGFNVVIVSNQAGIGDGKYTEEALRDINENMQRVIKENGGKIHAMFYCLHGKEAGCDCRKPKTGLFEQAEKELSPFNKETSFFIGDKLSDVQAGKAFGLKTALVLTGYGEKAQGEIDHDTMPDIIANDLRHAVEMILNLI